MFVFMTLLSMISLLATPSQDSQSLTKTVLQASNWSQPGMSDKLRKFRVYNDDQDTDEEADASKEEEEEEEDTMTLEEQQRLLQGVSNYEGEFLELPEKATRTVKWMTSNKRGKKVAIKRWNGWEVGVITAWHKKKWWVRFPRKLNTTGPIEQYAVDLEDDEYGPSGMWLFPKTAN